MILERGVTEPVARDGAAVAGKAGIDAAAGGVSQSTPPRSTVRNVTVPTLTGACVVLRAPRPSDIEDGLAHGRDRDIHRMYGGSGHPPPLTREQAVAEIEARMADPYAWVIEHESRCVGQIRALPHEACWAGRRDWA